MIFNLVKLCSELRVSFIFSLTVTSTYNCFLSANKGYVPFKIFLEFWITDFDGEQGQASTL